VKQLVTVEFSEEPYSELVDLWSFVSAGSAAVLVGNGFLVWQTVQASRYSASWWVLFLSTVIAAATEVRFYLGHRRYLKNLQWRCADAVDPHRAKWEFLLICLIKIFQVTMALALAYPTAFLNGFVGLMLCDLVWICFEPKVRNLENMKTSKACRWMWINLATAVLILIGSRFMASHNVELCAIGTICQLTIAATNCVTDLCTCSDPVDR
jgi:hypothetical protein